MQLLIEARATTEKLPMRRLPDLKCTESYELCSPLFAAVSPGPRGSLTLTHTSTACSPARLQRMPSYDKRLLVANYDEIDQYALNT